MTAFCKGFLRYTAPPHKDFNVRWEPLENMQFTGTINNLV